MCVRPRRHEWLGLSAILLGLSGCAGYQVGLPSLYRPNIRTVHVPVFECESFRRGLGERLTEAVIKEIEEKTPYKVVATPDADSVLTGRITTARQHVLAESIDNLPRDIQADLTVQVTWYDRRGDAILQDSSFVLAPLSYSAAQGVDFVPQAGQSISTAYQEAIERLARQIVSQMEAPW